MTPTEKQVSKMYYDCPIEAAYMAKNFGVKVYWPTIRENFVEEYAPDWLRIIETIVAWEGYIEKTSSYVGGKYYIHPDSLHIFEPQVGDTIGIVSAEGVETLGFYGGEAEGSKPNPFIRIIERNSKPFIRPEKEND